MTAGDDMLALSWPSLRWGADGLGISRAGMQDSESIVASDPNDFAEHERGMLNVSCRPKHASQTRTLLGSPRSPFGGSNTFC